MADLPKLNVVLDLDETLVHASIAGQATHHALTQVNNNIPSTDETRKISADTIEIRLRTENEELVSVNRRPGLELFLEASSKHFKLFAFTASESYYMNPLLDAIDPQKKYFGERRFSRDVCTQIGDGRYTKDLSKIAMSELGEQAVVNDAWYARTVLVDNNPFSFVPQPQNGIPVVSWYQNPEDVALSKVFQFLQQLQPMNDVRPFLDTTFHVEKTLNKFAEANGKEVFQPYY